MSAAKTLESAASAILDLIEKTGYLVGCVEYVDLKEALATDPRDASAATSRGAA
jgi:hypothetical protein